MPQKFRFGYQRYYIPDKILDFLQKSKNRFNQLVLALSQLPIFSNLRFGKTLYLTWFTNILIYSMGFFIIFQILFVLGSLGIWPGLGKWIGQTLPHHLLQSVELWIFNDLK